MSRTSTSLFHRIALGNAESHEPLPSALGCRPAVASLRFALPKPTPATVSVRAVDGRVVRTLLQGTLAAGEHDCRWDGRDELGASVPAGGYVLLLEAGGSPLTSRRVNVR